MTPTAADSFLSAYRALEPAGGLNDPSTSLVAALTGIDDMGGGVQSSAGVSVSPERALTYIPFYAGVRYLAESIGSLPMPVRRQEGRSRIGVGMVEDRRAYLLNDEPNPFQTAMQWRESMVGQANCWGNGYSLVEFDRSGIASGIWPLDPRTTAPYRAPDGALWYGMWTPEGTVAIPSSHVIHLKAFGVIGDVGISPVGVARQMIGEQLAAEDYAGRFWQNDASPGGVIQYAGKLKDDDHREAVRRWNAMHQGTRRKHLMAILDNGAEYKSVGMPLKDAQFLEARKFGYRQSASVLRIPPHKIGDLEGNVTFASIDAMELSAVIDSLRPWCVRFEQAVNRVLFPSWINLATSELSPDGRAGKYAQFNLAGLLRGDIATRSAFYAMGRQWGWFSINDIRELEDMPDIGPDGDIYLQPLNMVPTGTEPAEIEAGKPDDDARAIAQSAGLATPEP